MAQEEKKSESLPIDPLLSLQGIAKELFKELGGGEEFIRRERAAFLDASDLKR